jgi:hypothetical protein
MDAPKISQTVLLANPESAQLKEALSALKPASRVAPASRARCALSSSHHPYLRLRLGL